MVHVSSQPIPYTVIYPILSSPSCCCSHFTYVRSSLLYSLSFVSSSLCFPWFIFFSPLDLFFPPYICASPIPCVPPPPYLYLTGAFASVIVENSFKLATHLRKEHHDECRKSIRGISFRNLPLDNPLSNPFGGPFNDSPGGGINKHVPVDQRTIVVAAGTAIGTGTSLYGSLAPQGTHTFPPDIMPPLDVVAFHY